VKTWMLPSTPLPHPCLIISACTTILELVLPQQQVLCMQQQATKLSFQPPVTNTYLDSPRRLVQIRASEQFQVPLTLMKHNSEGESCQTGTPVTVISSRFYQRRRDRGSLWGSCLGLKSENMCPILQDPQRSTAVPTLSQQDDPEGWAAPGRAHGCELLSMWEVGAPWVPESGKGEQGTAAH